MLLNLKDGRFVNLDNCMTFEVKSTAIGTVVIKLRGGAQDTMEANIYDGDIDDKKIASIIKDRIIQLIMNGYNRGLKVVDIDVNNLKKYAEDDAILKNLEDEFE